MTQQNYTSKMNGYTPNDAELNLVFGGADHIYHPSGEDQRFEIPAGSPSKIIVAGKTADEIIEQIEAVLDDGHLPFYVQGNNYYFLSSKDTYLDHPRYRFQSLLDSTTNDYYNFVNVDTIAYDTYTQAMKKSGTTVPVVKNVVTNLTNFALTIPDKTIPFFKYDDIVWTYTHTVQSSPKVYQFVGVKDGALTILTATQSGGSYTYSYTSSVSDTEMALAIAAIKSKICYSMNLGSITESQTVTLTTMGGNGGFHFTLFNPDMDLDITNDLKVVYGVTQLDSGNSGIIAFYEFDIENMRFNWVCNTKDIVSTLTTGLHWTKINHKKSDFTKFASGHLYIAVVIGDLNSYKFIGNAVNEGFNTAPFLLCGAAKIDSTLPTAASLQTDIPTITPDNSANTNHSRLFFALTNVALPAAMEV